jgi:dTDP-4-dehydrorhamnose 3,5-epimerase
MLPSGVLLRGLKTHPDERGDFTELFRDAWIDSPLPVQWNVSRTCPNVLRGVHAHAKHWDYLCVIDGEMIIGLHDLRCQAAAQARSPILHLSAERLELLAIPPGVAHGFYSPDRSIHLVGASGYYDPTDHRRCRWDCPELGLDWPCRAPKLSPADRQAPGYDELKSAWLAAMAAVQHMA